MAEIPAGGRAAAPSGHHDIEAAPSVSSASVARLPGLGAMSLSGKLSVRKPQSTLTGILPVLALVALMWIEEIVDDDPWFQAQFPDRAVG